MADRTNVYNLTDVKDRPRSIKIFRQNIIPGGRLVLPKSMVTGRVEYKRLARMVTAKDVHVGLTPPAWYLRIKQQAASTTRAKQAQRLFRPMVAKTPVPSLEVVEPLFNVEEVMRLVKKLSKPNLLQFTTFVRPAPMISESMTMKEIHAVIETAFEDGSKLLPLGVAKKFLGLTEE
ncbi:MAG: hypothetical protein ABH877_04865 [bacterium]